MADDRLYIDRITLPSNNTYYIKDSEARADIALITGASALTFKGVSTTQLTDNGVEAPTITGISDPITLHTGDIYFYGSSEYIWGPDNKWHELGNLTALGGLAYKNNASTTYTPQGTISIDYRPSGSISSPTFSGTATAITVSASYTPEGSVNLQTTSRSLEITTSSTGNKSYQPGGSIGFTNSSVTPTITAATNTSGNYRPAGTVSSVNISLNGAGATTVINNPSPLPVATQVVAAAPEATAPDNAVTYYDVQGEVLKLYKIGYKVGSSISTSEVTVKTGDASYKMSGNPPFSGTTAQLTVSNVSVPQSASFTGTTVHLYADSFNLPTGVTFTGTEGTVSTNISYTPEGTVSAPGFTGSAVTLTTSLVGTQATITVG